MSKVTRSVVFWAPRILTILFALFLSLFAVDVFEETRGFLQTLGALLLHLMPSLLVFVFLAFAWRRELVGAVVFGGLAITYVVAMWGRFPLLTYATISGPLLLMSGLYLLSWRERQRTEAIEHGPQGTT